MKIDSFSYKSHGGALALLRPAFLLALLSLAQIANAGSAAWTNTTASVWLTAANWSPNSVPGALNSTAVNSDVATFTTNTISGNSSQINMNSASGNMTLGAILWNYTNANGSIGNNSTGDGTLWLNGASVNVGATGGTINNLLVAVGDSATRDLTLQNSTGSGTKLMNLQLTNAAGVIYVANNRALNISSSIYGVSGFTKSGAGVLSLSGTNNFSGAITVNAGTLALSVSNLNNGLQPANGNASSITMAAGTVLRGTIDGVVVTAPITVNSGASPVLFNTGTNSPGGGVPSTFYINSVIGGAGSVTFNCISNLNALYTVQLNNTNTYAGNTLLDNSAGTAGQIIVKLGTNNALPVTTVLNIDGQTGAGSGRYAELNLNGWSQTVSGLTNVNRSLRVQRVVNSDVSAAATFTVSNTANYTFSGNLGTSIANGSVAPGAMPGSTHGNNFSFVKSASGTFILSSNNTYTGSTTINGGLLQFNNGGLLGGGSYAGAISIGSGAALGMNGTAANNFGGTISGAGVLTNSGTGTLTISGTASGAVVNSGTALIISGTASGTLTNSGNGTTTVSGAGILNAASTVTAGKIAVTSTQTGTGGVTVNGGTLSVTASTTSQWSPATLTLTSGVLEFIGVTNVGTTTAPLSPTSVSVSAITVNVTSVAGGLPAAGNSFPLLGNQGGTTTGYTLGSQPPGVFGHLDVSGTTLVYVVDVVADLWAGTDAVNPSFWDVTTTTNWTGFAVNNSPANTYANSDAVLFDDTGTTTNVSIQVTVTPSSVNFNNTKTYTVTNGVSKVIGGSGSLTKSGSGTVTLLGGAAHTYSGGTTVSSGTLQLGDGTTGNDTSLSGTSAVTNNGTLIFNRFGTDTASYPISGSGAVSKLGAGAQTLSASNTYAGATTVTAGTLQLGANNVLPDGAAKGNVSVAGTLDLNGFSDTINGLSGAGVVDTISGGTPTLTVGANDQTSTFSGIITNTTGTLALTKTGTGTLSLTGSNGFTGALNVNGGSLTIAGTGYPALGGNSPGVNGPASITMASGTTLNFQEVGTGASTANYYQPITLNTTTVNTTGGSSGNTIALVLNGGVTLGGNSLIHPNGNSSLTIPSTTTVNLNSSTLTIQTDGSLASSIGAVISGAGGSLTKSSGSTLTLSGANTFTGNLTLSGGTLNLNNTNVFTNAVVTSGALALGNLQALSGATSISLGTATLSSALDTMTINAPITLTGNPTISLGRSSSAAGTFNLNGAISGTGNVTLHSSSSINSGQPQTTILGAASTFVGNVTITAVNINNQETVKAGAINALPATAVLTLDGGAGAGSAGRTVAYDLNGFNQTLAGISNTAPPLSVSRFQRITSSTGSPTLTISNVNDFAYGGIGATTNNGLGTVTGTATLAGTLALVKDGPATLTLNGPNSYTGNTTVKAGTLSIAIASIETNSTVSISNGAVLNLSFTTTNSVAGFITNGVSLAAGVYNAANVAPFITGTGSLKVVASGPDLAQNTLTNTISGGVLTLSWSPGWKLQVQTNALSSGLGNNWSYLTDGSVNSTNITLNPANPTVFYRLAYP